MPVFENYFVFVAITLGSLVLLTVGICVLQVYCKKYFGINFCPGAGSVMPDSARLARIRAMEGEQPAMEMEHQKNEEQRQKAIETKREERKTKYKALLKDNTMIVSEKDLVQDTGSSPADSGSCDIESGAAAEKHDDDADHWLLNLPIKNKDGETVRVPGHCAVCIAEYSPGDLVVWSTSGRCPHVFHEECILMWLSKGKKRCPICRNAFAPANISNHSVKDLSADDLDDEESEHSQERRLGSTEDTSQSATETPDINGQATVTAPIDIESQA